MLSLITNPKSIIIIGIILIFGTAIRFSYNAGEASATTLFQAEKLEIINIQNEELKNAIIKAKTQQRNEDERMIEVLRNEERIVESIRVVEKEIIVTKFVCIDLGDDFLRLFNNAIPP